MQRWVTLLKERIQASEIKNTELNEILYGRTAVCPTVLLLRNYLNNFEKEDKQKDSLLLLQSS